MSEPQPQPEARRRPSSLAIVTLGMMATLLAAFAVAANAITGLAAEVKSVRDSNATMRATLDLKQRKVELLLEFTRLQETINREKAAEAKPTVVMTDPTESPEYRKLMENTRFLKAPDPSDGPRIVIPDVRITMPRESDVVVRARARQAEILRELGP